MLTTVSRFASYLGVQVPGSGSNTESLMNTALEVAHEQVRSYLEWPVLEDLALTDTSVLVPYDGSATTSLQVNYAIRTLTSLERLETDGVTYTVIENWQLWPPSPIRRTAAQLPLYFEIKTLEPLGSRETTYRLQGRFGVTADDAPPSIVTAIHIVAKHFFDLLQVDATVQSQSGVSLSTIFSPNQEAIPRHAKMLLHAFRFVRI